MLESQQHPIGMPPEVKSCVKVVSKAFIDAAHVGGFSTEPNWVVSGYILTRNALAFIDGVYREPTEQLSELVTL